MSVLRAIPDVDAHDLHRLDEKLSANPTKPSKIDKSKRDLFKKITSRVRSNLNPNYDGSFRILLLLDNIVVF